MKIGIAGAGMTVPWFIEATAQIPEMEIGALFARREEKRRSMCEAYGIPGCYDSYEQLLEDETLEVLYIQVPNHLHFDFARRALKAGKHVILEKPFTVTAQEARELAALARERKRILFEAITNQYNPNYEKVRSLLPRLGNVKIVQLNFSQYSSRYEAFQRGEIAPVFDAGKAGGALMDLNVYNIHFVTGLFGRPSAVHYFPNVERNVDTSGILILEYPAFQCVCVASKDCSAPSSINIQGDEGCIFSRSQAGLFQEFSFQENKKEPISYALSNTEQRLYDELRAFTDLYVKK